MLRVFTFVPTILLLLLLSACATWPDTRPHTEPNAVVFMTLEDASSPGRNWYGQPTDYMIKVRFHEYTEYEGLIQEVELESGYVLVEYFRISDWNPTCRDGHSGVNSNGVRRMFVYPANVEGVDLRRGTFGHLPQNSDGSKVTNISPFFNQTYQMCHETRGRIVKEDKSLGFTWSFETDSEGKIEWIKYNGELIFP